MSTRTTTTTRWTSRRRRAGTPRGRVLAAAALVATALVGIPTTATAAACGCDPAVVELPLPPGANGGWVQSALGDTYLGMIRYPDNSSQFATWRRTGPRSFAFERALGLPPGTTSVRLLRAFIGMDVHGDMAMTAFDAAGVGHAFAWHAGQYYPLSSPAGASDVEVTGISLDGRIAGYVRQVDGVALVWSSWHSPYRTLDTGPEPYGEVDGMDAHGNMAGSVSDEQHSYPARWDREGRLTRLPGIDASAQAVAGRRAAGESFVGEQGTATSWDPGTPAPRLVGTIPPAKDNLFWGMNNRGETVGRAGGPQEPVTLTKAIYWPGDGPLLTLPPLAGDWATRRTMAVRITDTGDAVGGSGIAPADTPAGLLVYPTVWHCARQLAFLPPTSGQSAALSPLTAVDSVSDAKEDQS